MKKPKPLSHVYRVYVESEESGDNMRVKNGTYTITATGEASCELVKHYLRALKDETEGL